MDDQKAKQLEEKLTGLTLSKYKISKLLNYGKTAAVFHAEKDGEYYALKVFDNDLIKTYGGVVQKERIMREVRLANHGHEHLVKIFDGGHEKKSNFYYIVMEFIGGRNLKQCLNDIPFDEIGSYISQLASAAKFLEEKKIAHRDIKPENIMINLNEQKLILMDLGVVKQHGISGLTDGDGNGSRPFIGTLQYSPPELLLRNEKDNLEGWRAITYYQIGATLHDLIMRRPIFSEFETPYARLVNAVQHEKPEIKNEKVDERLITLANCCLLKDPDSRLKMINWSHFEDLVNKKNVDYKSKFKRIVELKKIEKEIKHEATDKKYPLKQQESRLLDTSLSFIKGCVKSFRTENSDTLPPCTVNVVKSKKHINVDFEKSENIGFKDSINFKITVNVIDVEAQALTVSLVATCEGFDDIKCDVFSSVYDGESLHSELDEKLYHTFSKFLQ